MYYKVNKMTAKKDQLPSYCFGLENRNAFYRIIELYMGSPDYETIMKWSDDDENHEIYMRYDAIVEAFCLECAKKEHDADTLCAVWCEWSDEDDDGTFSVIESYVDNGNGTIDYDYCDFDTSHISILQGDPMEVYDKEKDETVLLAIDDDDAQYSGTMKPIFRYSGFPNECITNAFMENIRNEKDTEPDTGFLK